MCINSNREFVHLHVHTDYSIGDSICSIYKKNRKNSDLVKMAQRYKMSAMAITDHQSIGGAIEFYKMMNSNAVKPIIGCEINIASSLHKPIGGVKQKSFHLVLLAKDFYGYQNLCKLTSAANLSPKAELSKELLSKHSKGLIGLSGCIHGEIPFLVFNDELRLAKSSLNDYIDIFGKENFYLELMNHRLPEQPMINSQLIKIGKEFNVPPVATNNVHYLEKEHAEIREIYASICCKTKVKLPTKEFYLKSGDEMHELFKEVPESISNTLAIAERCNLTIPLVPYVNHYPVYKIKTGKSEKDFLRNICLNNMLNRYGFDPEKLNKLNAKQQQTIDRIEFELNTIDSSRYCNYFLIVWDFLKYARNIGITVGPGGGYGAGSIVAYLTYITDLDPLRYGLLFREPVYREHIPPDFWIRLCGNRSKEVIEYVRNKYGTNCVAQIESYRKLSIIDVINDVRKVFGESFIKENQGKISRYSEILEGLNRNTYIFSDEEIIIGDQQLDSLTPVSKNSKNELITQYSASTCKLLGLLEIDFYGNTTLSVIQMIVDRIERIKGKKIDISKIPLDDKKTYNLINRGNTAGVYQLGSKNKREFYKKFPVTSIENIIALMALYFQPASVQLAYHLNCKVSKANIEYEHPKMKPILEETYGIILFREQVVMLAQELAGFTIDEADVLLGDIRKKEIIALAIQKKKFIEGCKKHCYTEEKEENAIWHKLTKDGLYARKSYIPFDAILAYRAAFLKANYAVEFMDTIETYNKNTIIHGGSVMPPFSWTGSISV